MRNTAAASLDDIFAQADFDRRLFKLRAANPHLVYELDELARAFRRVRDRVTAALAEPVPPQALPDGGDPAGADR